MAGFVKLYRSLLDWEWYMDVNTHRLFTHLLLTVNWKDGKWKGKTIKRGQRVTSIEKLSEETGLSNRQTRTALYHLQTTGEVTSTSTNKYTLITVEKYEEYQGCDDTTDKQTTSQMTNKRQTNDKPDDKQTTTIEERKNKEVKKKEIKDIYGTFNNVKLTDKEYETLIKEHGQGSANKAIEFLSAYREEKGYKNKSDYLSLKRWVFDAAEKQTKSSNPFKDYYLKEVENEQNRSSLSNGNHQDLLPRILPPGCGD